jgi:glutaredoxin
MIQTSHERIAELEAELAGVKRICKDFSDAVQGLEMDLSKCGEAYELERNARMLAVEQRDAARQSRARLVCYIKENEYTDWASMRSFLKEAEAKRDAIHKSIRTCTVCIRGWVSENDSRCPFCERDAAIAECRKRKGIEQDMIHYRERAEDSEKDAQALANELQILIQLVMGGTYMQASGHRYACYRTEILETHLEQSDKLFGQHGAKYLAEAIKQDDDPTRCAVCGWKLAESAEQGCVRGNCSMRPRPERLYAPERAFEEAK